VADHVDLAFHARTHVVARDDKVAEAAEVPVGAPLAADAGARAYSFAVVAEDSEQPPVACDSIGPLRALRSTLVNITRAIIARSPPKNSEEKAPA
jgi:hypothetical protein